MLCEEYGLHRVIGEAGILPQQARRLDPSLPLRSTELLIDVDTLHVDAASFQQIWREAGGNARAAERRIEAIVAERGKLHNPVTGSGGVLMGRVRQIGRDHPARSRLQPGDRVATLVSLSLTPLRLEEIRQIHPASEQVDVRGAAIVFSTGSCAKLPADLPDEVALAVLDVCGAPAQIARHVKAGMTVVVLGTGKAGVLCLAQARHSAGPSGRLIALDLSSVALDPLRRLGLCDAAIAVDATQPIEVMRQVAQAIGGAVADVAVNCASSPGTEMATVLCVKDGGTALFFSMATSFTAATLGAEGVGKDVSLVMGNGYVPGHAELALNLVRRHPGLVRLFESRGKGGPQSHPTTGAPG